MELRGLARLSCTASAGKCAWQPRRTGHLHLRLALPLQVPDRVRHTAPGPLLSRWWPSQCIHPSSHGTRWPTSPGNAGAVASQARASSSEAYGRRAELYGDDAFQPLDENPAYAHRRKQPATVYVHAPRVLPRQEHEREVKHEHEHGHTDVNEPASPMPEPAPAPAAAPPRTREWPSPQQVQDQEEQGQAEARGQGQVQGQRVTVSGLEPCPVPLSNFRETGFPAVVQKLLEGSGFAAPTPVQAMCWPVLKSGRDLVGLAQTGSGKTLAYLLPALLHASTTWPSAGRSGPSCLILAPTRELAKQIQVECARFGQALGLKEAVIHGGVPRKGQLLELKSDPEVCIATPGRLLAFAANNSLRLTDVSFLVVDEADRMFDLGFAPQIRSIVSQLPPARQTLMWSATWPRQMQHLAADICKENPVIVSIGDDDLRSNPNIRHEVVVVHDLDKRQRFFEWLRHVSSPDLQAQPRVLVFVETKRASDALKRELIAEQYSAASIHSDMDQSLRGKVLESFRSGRVSILVATDVAQRGLDIPDITHVVNFDLPNTVEDYQHRIGRTARASAVGSAVTFYGLGRMTPDRLRMAQGIASIMRSVGQEPPPELQRLVQQGQALSG